MRSGEERNLRKKQTNKKREGKKGNMRKVKELWKHIKEGRKTKESKGKER